MGQTSLRQLRCLTVALAVIASSTSCSNAAGARAKDRADECGDLASLKPFLGDLRFASPTVLLQHPVNALRWYVGEQRGVIFTILNLADSATPQTFVDLTDRVDSTADEAGLLGVAFHPDFADNGQVFVSYTATSAIAPAKIESRVSRFISPDRGRTLDPATEEILLRVDQPFVNHNGGHIVFGPDRMLYIALGDGGSANDPLNNSQKTSALLGKLLRIDVDGDGPRGQPFAVPSDNPLVGRDGRAEVWALGLRNPWRFTFDRDTGALWLGDVGQKAFEEINLIERGGNYGWPLREGGHCNVESDPTTCEQSVFAEPIVEYGRDLGISVTGGYVYRGERIPELRGKYVFGDFGSGNLFAVSSESSRGTLRDPKPFLRSTANPSTFAEDAAGELYLVDFVSGAVFQVVPAGECEGAAPPASNSLGDSVATTFSNVFEAILSVRCSPCHTQRALGGFGMTTEDAAFSALVGAATTTEDCAGRKRVVAGDPENSVLFQKLSGVNLCGPEMPPSEPLSDLELDFIRRWIEAGAPR